MAGWRRPIELAVNDVEVAVLKEISRSRSEPAIRVQRAPILLAYREGLSFFAVGHAVGGTIRRSSAAWSEPQSTARWQPSMTGRRPGLARGEATKRVALSYYRSRKVQTPPTAFGVRARS